jgi:hypothetical protein
MWIARSVLKRISRMLRLSSALKPLVQTQVLYRVDRRGKCFKLEEIAELGCVRPRVP